MTDLTDKWNKGELPEGDYYIKRRNGILPYDNIDSRGVWRNSIDEDIVEVLAPVPSYEEWDKLNNACHELEKETACLTVDNVNLKKWCEEFNALNVAKENTKLKTDCKTLVQKLLQVKPELREWLEVNYKEYL